MRNRLRRTKTPKPYFSDRFFVPLHELAQDDIEGVKTNEPAVLTDSYGDIKCPVSVDRQESEIEVPVHSRPR